MAGHVLLSFALGVEPEHAAEQPLGARGPELGVQLLRQPAGEAHVIGMEVGADQARRRPAVLAADAHPLEHLAPDRLALVALDAGVDQRPALAVLEQPEIDVIEPVGQRHAQPMHARRHLQRLAGAGQARRVAKGEDERVHAATLIPASSRFKAPSTAAR